MQTPLASTGITRRHRTVQLEALKKMYVWREGRFLGWLKRNELEHLPNTTRAAVVWVMLERSGVKFTM